MILLNLSGNNRDGIAVADFLVEFDADFVALFTCVNILVIKLEGVCFLDKVGGVTFDVDAIPYS